MDRFVKTCSPASDQLPFRSKSIHPLSSPLVEATTVQAPIGWIGQGVRGVTESGKAARTHFVPRASTDDASLVEARIDTGRTHQIRIHAAHIGHPVIGDARYGEPSRLIGRPALHAWRIEAGGRELEAPLPADLSALIEELALQ